MFTEVISKDARDSLAILGKEQRKFVKELLSIGFSSSFSL